MMSRRANARPATSTFIAIGWERAARAATTPCRSGRCRSSIMARPASCDVAITRRPHAPAATAREAPARALLRASAGAVTRQGMATWDQLAKSATWSRISFAFARGRGRFDHDDTIVTVFPLERRHQTIACRSCHPQGEAVSGTDLRCLPRRSSLGTDGTAVRGLPSRGQLPPRAIRSRSDHLPASRTSLQHALLALPYQSTMGGADE